MKRAFLLSLTAAAAAAAIFAGAYTPAAGNQRLTASRDMSDAEVRRTMDLIFRAQVHPLLSWTDSLATECRGEPMFHVMRARLMRELVPVDDAGKQGIQSGAAPLYDELRTAIARCDERIEGGDNNEKLRLYRGWAWMMMSHVHTYEEAFWSAGREAKKGKSDLEWYLQRHPGDPVASSLMGAFLYFADTLPSAYKFVSKLLFLPSGDRDRGLRMMEEARGTYSPMQIDNELILYSCYLGFEGRYEDGLEGFHRLQERFPLHATFLRADAIMFPLLPQRTNENADSLDARTASVSSLPKNQVDTATCSLILFERAYADRFYDPKRAIERFERLRADNHPHPDWVPGFSAYELGCLHASLGEMEAARREFDVAARDDRVDYLHGDVKAALSALEKYPHGTGLGPADVSVIYGSDEMARKHVRDELAAKKDPTPADQFYLGEAWLMSGELDMALNAYIGLINPPAAPWDQAYQMIAYTRAGEIFGKRGEYEAAMKHYEGAASLWHKEYLLDWVLEGRRRYFERLSDGKETIKPTLLTAAQ